MKSVPMSNVSIGPDKKHLGIKLQIRPPDMSAYLEKYFPYCSSKTYAVDTQKNRLNETVLLSTQNTCFN